MNKLIILLACCLTLVSASQSDLDRALDEFHSKREAETSWIRSPPRRKHQRSSSKMKRSSPFSRQMHDLFTFTHEFTSQIRAKRDSFPAGFTINSKYCPYKNQTIVCNATSKYRTNDGTCNNLKTPLMGAKNTPYIRLLSPAYDDGVNSPRGKSVTGKPLTNPREISLAINSKCESCKFDSKGIAGCVAPFCGYYPLDNTTSTSNDFPNLSQLFAFYGQFITHDMVDASTTTDKNGDQLHCGCGSTDPNCMPIKVPDNDLKFGNSMVCDGKYDPTGTCKLMFSKAAQSCMNFTRSSASFPTFDCSTSYREQLNLISAYLDGSAVYGKDNHRAAQLRSFTGGLLRTSQSNNMAKCTMCPPGEKITPRPYLPLANDLCNTCEFFGPSCGQQFYNFLVGPGPMSNDFVDMVVGVQHNISCYLGGEHRTSENLGLASIQTLFLREHNRIAGVLAKINPKWNDETIYQETRRIVVAELQHVTYNEFVPLLLSDKSLMPLKTNEYFTGYDPKVNAQVTGEFATAAFRMGHSLINNFNSLSNINQNYTGKSNLYFPSYEPGLLLFWMDEANDPRFGGLNAVMLGNLNDQTMKFGEFNFQLQHRLQQFNNFDGSYRANSSDLLSVNINRGRDHGLQPYVKYIQKCFPNLKINSFDDLAQLNVPARKIQILKSVYANIADIDLYAGGLSESTQRKNQNPTVVGPTFQCILMEQFLRLKTGDRFWYENGPSTTPSAFTLSQLQEIKSVTLSGMICNNFDVNQIQQQAFLQPKNIMSPFGPKNNAPVTCSSLSRQLDLTKWAA